MKVKINEYGHLEIWRKDKYKDQYCPYITEQWIKSSPCGDWCSLFGEPFFFDYHADDSKYEIQLRICNKLFLLHLEGFTDER